MKKLKLSRKEKLLFVFPLLILLVPLVVSVLKTDKLDGAIAKFREPDSVNCGALSGPEENQEKMVSCLVQAYKTGRPFHMRYSYSDTVEKTHTSYAWVGKSDGKIYWLVQNRKAWRLPHRVEVSIREARITLRKDGTQSLRLTEEIIPLPDFE